MSSENANAPKVKKPRKSKIVVDNTSAAVVDNTSAAVVPDADVKTVDNTSGAVGAKAPRHPRFDPNVPSNYFNLQDVWDYRDSQRRNLQKMKLRVENAKDETERAKLSLNVLRNEKNLRQLEENMTDVQRQSIMVAELLRAGVQTDEVQVAGVVKQLVAGLVAAKQ